MNDTITEFWNGAVEASARAKAMTAEFNRRFPDFASDLARRDFAEWIAHHPMAGDAALARRELLAVPTRVEFFHCWGCRLPASPSGRRVWVDGMEARGEAIERTCALVRQWRSSLASSPLVG